MTKAMSSAALAIAALSLASCATPTPYRPATGYDRTGYAEQRIAANRYRVTFSGNSMTSREKVERYLLYRAAQLTVEQGYGWFTMADRATERHSSTYVDRPFGAGPYGWWGPSWRYRGAGFGWRRWDPLGGDPFWDRNVDIRTVNRYEADAEIVFGQGPRPAQDLRAFDASEVLQNLGPGIQMPS
jgi:hypothetical protein